MVASSFRTRAALQAEILALRHQLAVLQKNAPRRLRFHRCDRFLWVVLSRFWSGWRRCLQMVQPDTVLRWHRRAFAWHWSRKSRRLSGRPEVASNIRDLIRRMSQANPLWGAPRIHGELLKLGIAVAQSTVTQYLPRRRKPPSQTWPSRRAGGAPGSEWLRHSGERGRSWNGTPSSLPGESRSGPQRIQDHRTVLARSRPMTGCHTHNSTKLSLLRAQR